LVSHRLHSFALLLYVRRFVISALSLKFAANPLLGDNSSVCEPSAWLSRAGSRLRDSSRGSRDRYAINSLHWALGE
jgi:hypothetical protein